MKTRDISQLDFYKNIQLEYIQAELRSKIYKRKKDKEFWARVASLKKEKIEDFFLRNNLPNIFNSKSKKVELYYEFYLDGGYPNFFYKNDVQRLGDGNFAGLEQTDFENYYSIGSNVNICVDRESIIDTIVNFNFELKYIDTAKHKFLFPKNVTRII